MISIPSIPMGLRLRREAMRKYDITWYEILRAYLRHDVLYLVNGVKYMIKGLFDFVADMWRQCPTVLKWLLAAVGIACLPTLLHW